MTTKQLILCTTVVWAYGWYMHGLDVGMDKELKKHRNYNIVRAK